MNRDSIKSREFYGSLEYAKLTHKYYSLLEDYLELQKEYVSKKKKLQVKKEKREILLDEVRFLRQRYKNLKKSQVAKVEPELGPCQNANIHDLPMRRR